jgi:hypothetical protein
MKRKTKRFNGESESVVKDFASTGPDVEDLKKGMFARAAAPDESDTYAPKTRTFSTVKPAKPQPRAEAPKVKTGSGASGFGLKDPEMESASSVMKRGQAGASDSGKNAALDKLMSDREANASREARRRSAMVDKANAGVPERRSNVDVAKERLAGATSGKQEEKTKATNTRYPTKYGDFSFQEGFKKGGKVSSASSRADGIAQKGKTRGKMC